MKIRQMPEQIAFRSDTKHRKEWLTGVHFAHPAKLNLSLQLYLYERYTKPGDVVLDPMAGSGTALLGCALGRHVICVELEPRFLDMMRGNWEKIRQRGPQMGYQMGDAVILQGDSRHLEGLLADVVMFSPPYAGAGTDEGSSKVYTKWAEQHGRNPEGHAASGWTQRQYASSPDNIGNLVYGDISAIVTSPPYGEGGGHGGKATKCALEKRQSSMGQGTDNLYSQAGDNIGNLKGPSYLETMAQVYAQCHQILKPGGLLILVVKPFIRDKAIVPLQEHTRTIVERCGFVYVEELHRKLLAQSFWRILYRQRFPGVPLLDTEYILVFRKVG